MARYNQEDKNVDEYYDGFIIVTNSITKLTSCVSKTNQNDNLAKTQGDSEDSHRYFLSRHTQRPACLEDYALCMNRRLFSSEGA